MAMGNVLGSMTANLRRIELAELKRSIETLELCNAIDSNHNSRHPIYFMIYSTESQLSFGWQNDTIRG